MPPQLLKIHPPKPCRPNHEVGIDVSAWHDYEGSLLLFLNRLFQGTLIQMRIHLTQQDEAPNSKLCCSISVRMDPVGWMAKTRCDRRRSAQSWSL
eukprot:2616315-Karenia_brevis.AAC.1